MTNEEIVMRESLELMKQGIIVCAGQVDAIDENGNKCKMDMPEAIHTYQEWKMLGYQVKKGEHAVAKFAVWKPTKQKKAKDEEEQEDGTIKVQAKPRFFMANASWFTIAQVEKIDGKEVQ